MVFHNVIRNSHALAQNYTMAYPTAAATYTGTTSALNYTDTGDVGPSGPLMMSLSAKVVVGIVCGIMILVVLVGNTFVVVAVAKFRRLRTPANALLLNLAIADIAVSMFVMTFSTMRLLSDGNWLLGSFMCKFWMSMDVLCCTASILNLCMISLDKYWAITRPLSYRREMTWRRTVFMMTFVWCCSGIISFVPIFTGLYAKEKSTDDDICGVNFSVNKYYAIVSSMTSFYIPLAVMLFTYCRILVIARSQAIRIEMEMSRSEYLERASPQCSVRSSAPLHKTESGENGESIAPPCPASRRRSRSITREYKAVLTLGLVMGCFILSWLPFFLMYVIMNFCSTCYLSRHVENAITWLGYGNSLMNPFIYNIRNRDFRYAFHTLAHMVLNMLSCGYMDKQNDGVFPRYGGNSSHPRHRLSASSNGQMNGNHVLNANKIRMEVLKRPPSEGIMLCAAAEDDGRNDVNDDIPCDGEMITNNNHDHDDNSSNGSARLATSGEPPAVSDIEFEC